MYDFQPRNTREIFWEKELKKKKKAHLFCCKQVAFSHLAASKTFLGKDVSGKLL